MKRVVYNIPRSVPVALFFDEQLNLRDSQNVKTQASSKRLLCIRVPPSPTAGGFRHGWNMTKVGKSIQNWHHIAEKFIQTASYKQSFAAAAPPFPLQVSRRGFVRPPSPPITHYKNNSKAQQKPIKSNNYSL